VRNPLENELRRAVAGIYTAKQLLSRGEIGEFSLLGCAGCVVRVGVRPG
jgi:hypothetical protein